MTLTIGEQMRRILEKRKLKSLPLSIKMGVHLSLISKVLKDHRAPSADFLDRFCKVTRPTATEQADLWRAIGLQPIAIQGVELTGPGSYETALLSMRQHVEAYARTRRENYGECLLLLRLDEAIAAARFVAAEHSEPIKTNKTRTAKGKSNDGNPSS